MNAQSTEFNFEKYILNSDIDLIDLEKSVPFKTLEQYRKEWLLERIGKFTASEFHRLLTHPTKTELPPGALSKMDALNIQPKELLIRHITAKLRRVLSFAVSAPDNR